MKLPTSINYIAKSGLMLMPQSCLPVIVDRPADINKVELSLANERFIGIIQPLISRNIDTLHKVGCLGKIINFTEQHDSSISIVIEGIKRFCTTKITPDILTVDYNSFPTDNIVFNKSTNINNTRKAQIISVLQEYNKTANIDINWSEIHNICEETLINNLAMICPFNPQQKQAILESKTVYDRVQMVTAFMEMENAISSNKQWILN